MIKKGLILMLLNLTEDEESRGGNEGMAAFKILPRAMLLT